MSIGTLSPICKPLGGSPATQGDRYGALIPAGNGSDPGQSQSPVSPIGGDAPPEDARDGNENQDVENDVDDE